MQVLETRPRAAVRARRLRADRLPVRQRSASSRGSIVNVDREVVGTQLPALRALAVGRPAGRDVLQPDGRPQARLAQQPRRRVDERGHPRQHAPLRDRVLPAAARSATSCSPPPTGSSQRAPEFIFDGDTRVGRVRRADRDRGRRPRHPVRHDRRAARRLQVGAPARRPGDRARRSIRTYDFTPSFTIKTDETGARVLFRWDTLDNPYFPRNGLRVNAEGFFGNRTTTLPSCPFGLCAFDAEASSRAGLYANAAFPLSKNGFVNLAVQAGGHHQGAGGRSHQRLQPRRLPAAVGAAHRPAVRRLPGFRPRRLLPPDRQPAAAGPRHLRRRLARGRQHLGDSAATFPPAGCRRRQRVRRRRHLARPVLLRVGPRERRPIELLHFPWPSLIIRQEATDRE